MKQLQNEDYRIWIAELKQKVYSVQVKASIAVNSALIEFYFFLGKSISEKENIWGAKLIEQTSKDLKAEFPDMKGFSVSNLKYCRYFYLFYSKVIGQQAVDQLQNTPPQGGTTENRISQKAVDQFGQQVVAQIPWGHNILIFTKSKEINEALFYINQTIENNWGRETLALQIKSDLYRRTGKAVTNFRNTRPNHCPI